MDRNRFSLLLLEPGEYYFDDYSVYLSTDDKVFLEKEIDNGLIGRLKICSKSLVFDPRALSRPLIKIPFKECSLIERYTNTLFSSFSEIMTIESDLFVEMLGGNMLAPFVFRHNHQKFYVLFNYAKVDDCLSHVSQLHRASTLPVADQNQMIAAIASDRQTRIQFDEMWLCLDEKFITEALGNKVTPLVVNPGKIILTNHNLFFQPFNNIEQNEYVKIKLSDIKSIINRRFLLKHVGLELYCKESGPTSHLYLSLKTKEARDELYNTIKSQPALNLDESDQEIMTLQWQNGTISNYDYLMYINSMGDRTFNDLTQYPVLPWVISDYSSDTLDLTNTESFRDLSKPVGALNPERLKRLKARYNEMPAPRFLYGSHYSTPGFVLFYLVRKYPNYMLCLQNGKFDHPDRMFNSVADVWKNVLSNMSDFKELVPEFYDTNHQGDFLRNMYGVNFGYKHDGVRVGDVILPPWSKDPEDFVMKLREALECDYVSAHLHMWIDLIFGYKQSGIDAKKADNKFYYLCYEGAIDLDSIKDWNKRQAVEIQIMEFGQIPKQVFKKPHPPRTCATIDVDSSLLKSVTAKIDYFKQHDFDYYWKWNSLNSKELYRFKTHKEEVTDIAVCADSSTVFSVSRDTLLKMYNVTEFKQERSLTLNRIALTCILLLEDNITAIIGCCNCEILVYNIVCGSIIDTINAHEDSVTGIVWCKKTRRLISASIDGFIRIWRSHLPWTPVKLTTGLIAELQHETKVPCISLSSDEEFLASGSEEGEIFIWNLHTYKVVYKLTGHDAQITDVKFSPGVERVISCGLDRSFRVFDLATGLQVYTKTLDQELNCLLWDGCRLLLGGGLGTLFVWNLVKNSLVLKIDAHDGVSHTDNLGGPAWWSTLAASGSLNPLMNAINRICSNSDGSVIVTAGRDKTVRIWSATM